MTLPVASLSLDLDNKWSYLRTHGIEGWETYPSYLDVAVPRVLQFCRDWNLRITCFVVGRDAEQAKNRPVLAAIAKAGHEIGNHSLNHYPWMHTLSPAEIESEIVGAEQAIENATGQRPLGFRAPGYSYSPDALAILARRGYVYDASILPTFIGPLARWYFCRTASREAADRASQRGMFGSFREGFRSLRPHIRRTPEGPLVEIPVTTCPLLKSPIHMTYLLQLWQFSPTAARLYLHSALAICRLLRIRPSILLHPLDFLGSEDDPQLRFFPGMNVSRAAKHALLTDMLWQLTSYYRVVPLRQHAERILARAAKKSRTASRTASEPLVAAIGK